MMLFETQAPDAPRPAGPHDGAALAPHQAPLDDALHLLQADPGHSLADPGLARLTQVGLDRLFVAARRQADRSHQGILLLLDLLPLAQRADPAAASRLVAGTARQFKGPGKLTPVDAKLRLDLEALIRGAVGSGLVFLCNPNNPTSSVHTMSDIEQAVRIIKQRSPETGILIDEAYLEYATLPGSGNATRSR